MNKRKAIAAANAALPPQIRISYSSRWKEWRVHYPITLDARHETLAPAADFSDACGTAVATAEQMRLPLRGNMTLVLETFSE